MNEIENRSSVTSFFFWLYLNRFYWVLPSFFFTEISVFLQYLWFVDVKLLVSPLD